ncbi:rho guanine nucleotide exchange factor 39-like [Mytilus trossulus]|uniref:rho guanine nucleotide exchange factor 39-like n=1 Tax=Mytilus trossulus TaxID=6551 RepID=UPI003004B52C
MLTTRSRFKVLNEIAQQNKEQIDTVTEEKREKRRKKVIRELFETEKTYLNHLELVNKYFDFPLRFNCLIPDSIHNKIFGNIEQICEVNKTLQEYMEQTTIGQAFHYLGPFLKLYSSYANNHETALAALQEWLQKSTEFKDFIQTQEERSDLNGLKLNALLITPVQRIPRYRLLLEDLLQCTTEEHHDYIQIKESAQQVGEIASHINEHIKQHENFQKMLSIQKCFDSSAPKILAPGREFLREGVLKKVSRKGGKSHDRMFFLFSDMMLYGKAKFLDSGNNTYSCCCVLPLKHCQVERMFGQSKNGNTSLTETGGMFSIACKDESLLLLSHDPENVQQWVETLESAIKKLCKDRSTLRKPSSNKLPMRGKSLWRQKKQEKMEEKKMKAKLQPVTEDTTTCPESPCLPDGLSPFKKTFPDIISCMSPKRRKLQKDRTNSPLPPPRQRKRGVASISDDYSSSPVPKRLTRRPLSESEYSQASDVFEDTNDWITTSTPSADCTENTFMQVTMDDLDLAEVTNNSFCQPKANDEKASTDVYYTNSYRDQKSQTCTRKPFTRLLNTGRGFTKRCHSAINNVQTRISETKQNCSIQ